MHFFGFYLVSKFCTTPISTYLVLNSVEPLVESQLLGLPSHQTIFHSGYILCAWKLGFGHLSDRCGFDALDRCSDSMRQ